MTRIFLCALCASAFHCLCALGSSATLRAVMLQLQVLAGQGRLLAGRDRRPRRHEHAPRDAGVRKSPRSAPMPATRRSCRSSRARTRRPGGRGHTRSAPEDAAGPFAPDIPHDLVEQASLPALSYRTPLEALAEKFHASPALLGRLNPAADSTQDERINVPNVKPAEAEPRESSAGRRAVGTAGTTAAPVVVRVSKQRPPSKSRGLMGRSSSPRP